MSRHQKPEHAELQNKPAIRVAVTGAAGLIGSYLCPMIAQGRMFGPHQKVILHLIELPFAQKALDGLVMELNDGAYDLLEDIVATTDILEGFKDIDVACLVGARPRGPGMERADLLLANKMIFVEQGAALDKVAKKSVKVCVVGNPANTNALICQRHAPSIPKENFSALTRLDQNRAYSMVSQKTKCAPSKINDLFIWGNHSSTQYPDTHFTTVDGKLLAAEDREYFNGEFLTLVQKRGQAIIDTCGKSSSSSAANAIVDHMHDWWHGTRTHCCSMGVISNGNQYGVPEDLIFSFPLDVNSDDKNWKIRQYELNEFQKAKLEASWKELLAERKIALDF